MSADEAMKRLGFVPAKLGDRVTVEVDGAAVLLGHIVSLDEEAVWIQSPDTRSQTKVSMDHFRQQLWSVG